MLYPRCTISRNQTGICRENAGYVTPDVENKLQQALKNPDIARLDPVCRQALTEYSAFVDPEGTVAQFDAILQGSYFDIDTMLVVDPNTGRKHLGDHAIGYNNFSFMNLHRSISQYFSEKYPNSIPPSYVQECQDLLLNITQSFHQ